MLRRAVPEYAADGRQRVSGIADQDDLGAWRVSVDDVEDSVEPACSLLSRRVLRILAVDEAADQHAVIVGVGQLLDQPAVTGLVVGESEMGGRQAGVSQACLDRRGVLRMLAKAQHPPALWHVWYRHAYSQLVIQVRRAGARRWPA